MPSSPLVSVPFILDFSHLSFDGVVIFIVSVLTAVTVNAEGQAIMASLLGDLRKDPKDRFHFNPLLHLDISGTFCFMVAGFGWPRRISVDTSRFKHPAIYLLFTRMAGPMANLLLAGIAGSILWVMGEWGVEDQVFSVVVSVNLMVFIFSFLPLPPLAGSSLAALVIPEPLKKKRFSRFFMVCAPYATATLFFLVRFRDWPVARDTFHPLVRGMFSFLSG